MIDIEKCNVKELISEITSFGRQKKFNFKTGSIIDLIISFCEENNIDEDDVGEKLQQDKGFVKMVEEDMMRSRYVVGKRNIQTSNIALEEF